MTDTPKVSPLGDYGVFWMTRPSDGVRVLVMNVDSGENAAKDEHEAGILALTTDMAAKLLARIEQVTQLKALDLDLSCVQFRNTDLDYFGWDWDAEVPLWADDPGRTEMDRLEVTDAYVEWRCYIKHTDDLVTTAILSVTDLRAFVAGDNPWPVVEPTSSEETE